MPHKVFVSFAGPDADADFDRFFLELASYVAPRLGDRVAAEDVFFLFRQDIKPGVAWPSALIAALADCKLFLYARSPNYFATPACGQEWAAFSKRVSPATKAAMVPLLWIPIDTRSSAFSDEIRDAFAGPDQFGAEYYSGALQRLMVRRSDQAYREFKTEFGDYLVEALRDPNLTLEPLDRAIDFKTLPNAFTPLAPPNRQGGGDRFIRFAIAAGTRHDMAALRSNTVEYDDAQPMGWRPFDVPIWKDLVAAAQNADLPPDLVRVDGNLVDLLRQAERDLSPIVVVVDSWSAHLDPFATALTAYDQQLFDTAGVIVPQNETRDLAEPQVTRNIRDSNFNGIFRRRLREPSLTFRLRVGPRAVFEAELVKLIETLRQRILDSRPNPPPAGPAPPDKPELGTR